MVRTKWTERTFTFDFPEGWMFNIIERLHGTHARLHEITRILTNEQLTYTPNGKWTVKEHIGHLSDLEELHEGRLNDFIVKKDVLRAADMTNAKTISALHNERTMEDLLLEFSSKRSQFISKLQSLSDDILVSKSMHSRLQVLMRPVDVAYFTAEHDDHHLASIRELVNKK